MPANDVPLPDPTLTNRVGWVYTGPDGPRLFEQFGRASREEIVGLLPGGWDFAGKRVLDFGCGSGRILRHFLDESEQAELWGCDIDAPSIAWLEEHLSPPLHVFRNDELPPLPFEDASLDLIWAASVFTHLGSSWSAWMAELHRVLAPDGLLLASYIGAGTAVPEAAAWDEDRIGMNVIDGGLPYEHGGAVVLHSNWWLRAHWGRAFVIEHMTDPADGRQGWVVMRKRDTGPVSSEDLEAPEPGDPREFDALRHNIAQMEARQRATHQAHMRTQERLDEVVASRSWRMTAPLRAMRGRRS